MSADIPNVPGEPPPPSPPYGAAGATPPTGGGRTVALGTAVGLGILLVLSLLVLFVLGPIWPWAWTAGLLSLLGYFVVAIVFAARDETRLFGTGLLIGFGAWIVLGAGTCVALLAGLGG